MSAAVHFLISFWVKHRAPRTRDRGATAAEYALMAALIAAVIVVAVAFLGVGVSELFGSTADQIPSV